MNGKGKRSMKKVFIWEDIEEWIDIFKKVKSIEDYYTHIRLYHACKPSDIESYYTKGIQPLHIEYIKNIAYNIFHSDSFPEIKDIDIDGAIQKIQSVTHEGIIYFALDKRDLVQYCGHYLIYGSEFILGIANELRRKYGKDYSKLLKDTGIPTVLICDIPIDTLSKVYINDLNKKINNNKNKSGDSKYHDAPVIDFSIPIGQGINPNCIVSHYHPSTIPDPIDYNKIYKTDVNKCSRCSKEVSHEKD